MLLLAQSGFSQVIIEKKSHDLGNVKSEDFSYTDFTIQNNADKNLYFLRAEASENIIIKYSSKTIAPDSAQFMRVKYISKKTGPFKEEIKLFLSDRSEPVRFTIQGYAEYIEQSKSPSCPDFSASARSRKVDENSVTIEVVDSKTNEPLENVSVEIYFSMYDKYIMKTNKHGKIVKDIAPDKYALFASAPGYQTERKDQYIPRNGYLLFRLDKLKEEPIWGSAETKNEDPKREEHNDFVKENEFLIEVVDAKTLKPIEFARIDLSTFNNSHRNTIENSYRTNPYGKASIKQGLNIFVGAHGYNTVVYDLPQPGDFGFSSKRNILIKLIPNLKEEIAEVKQEPKEDPVKKDTVIPSIQTPDISLETGELSRDKYVPNNIVFLIDISSSMNQRNRIDILKGAMIELLKKLRDIDRIAVITYASTTKIILPSSSAANKEHIAETIFELKAEGLTAGEKGIMLAYDVAKDNFIKAGNNEIIIATDGAFNVGGDKESMIPHVKRQANNHIHLSVIGVKNAQVVEEGLKELSKNGEGTFIKINSEEDSKTKLIEMIKDHSNNQN